MITKKTVLVLGAGASFPYGLPTGLELTNIVCADHQKPIPKKHSRVKRDLAEAGFRPYEIEEFINALRESGKLSVDAFLEYRTDFLEIGKAAIASVLISLEDRNELFSRSNPGSWYLYLYGRLDAPYEDFAGNQLSIMTFNYDRSLTQFLSSALANTYNKALSNAYARLCESIPIFHVHGDLGPLPGEENGNHGYGDKSTGSAILDAAKTALLQSSP